MKRLGMGLTLGLLLACAGGCGQREGEEAGRAIAWVEELRVAREQSARTGKPIMIDFYASWCGPCRIMDKSTYRNAKVVAALDDWISLKVDVDRHRDLAERFRVEAVPTILLVQPDGTIAVRHEGFMSAGALLARLQQVRSAMTSQPSS